jgi:hypothetical protein
MCTETRTYHPACGHAFHKSYVYCDHLLAKRRGEGSGLLAWLTADLFGPCEFKKVVMEEADGLCPTCAWAVLEKQRVRDNMERGMDVKRGLGLQRTDV